MKISKTTLAVLSSFTALNPSIRIKEGNVLATVNVGMEDNKFVPIKSVLVRAEVEETFPRDVCIYNLKQLLQIVSTFTGEPEFDFTEDHLVISVKNKKVKFAYCKPTTIISPKNDIITVAENGDVVSFILDVKSLVQLKKLSNIIKNDDLFIRSTPENFVELVLTNDVDASNECNILVEKEVESKFDIKISMKNIAFVDTDTDYNVKIVTDLGGSEILQFNAIDKKLTYFIALKA